MKTHILSVHDENELVSISMHVGISGDEKSNTHISFHEGKKPIKCVNCESTFHKEVGKIMAKNTFKCDSCDLK